MVFALVMLVSATAPAPVQLRYDRGDTSCPSRERLLGAVSARLGLDPFDDAANDRVEVRVTRVSEGLLAKVTRFSGEVETGSRELSSPTTDCSELFRALELAVAIAIDPRAGLVRPAPTAPVAPPPRVEETKPPLPAESPFGFHAGLGVAGALGVGPTPTLGFTVLGGIQHGRFGLDVGARVELPSTVSIEPNASVSTQAFLADLALCVAVQGFRFCALGEAGALRLVPSGLSAGAAPQVTALGLAGVRVAYEWSLNGWLVLRPSLDFGAALGRTRVVSQELVWETPPVMGSLNLQLLWSPESNSQ